ncbi:hypothetical protein ACHAWF_008595 [Thalassiosira exigua]
MTTAAVAVAAASCSSFPSTARTTPLPRPPRVAFISAPAAPPLPRFDIDIDIDVDVVSSRSYPLPSPSTIHTPLLSRDERKRPTVRSGGRTKRTDGARPGAGGGRGRGGRGRGARRSSIEAKRGAASEATRGRAANGGEGGAQQQQRRESARTRERGGGGGWNRQSNRRKRTGRGGELSAAMRAGTSPASLTAAATAFAPSTPARSTSSSPSASASKCGTYDFDVIVVGCGVGGHGAALHSRAQDLTTAVFSGKDVGGTCVNRGCVPSKALLAASGRVREMQAESHLSEFGIKVEGEVTFDREGVANHAKQLANRVKGNLEGSLVALGVDMVEGRGVLTGTPHEVKDESTGKVYTAKGDESRRLPRPRTEKRAHRKRRIVRRDGRPQRKGGVPHGGHVRPGKLFEKIGSILDCFFIGGSHCHYCSARLGQKNCDAGFRVSPVTAWQAIRYALFGDMTSSSPPAPSPSSPRASPSTRRRSTPPTAPSGSVPFVPPGVTVDEKTVYTSDGALELQSVPEWVAIIGSGYIGLEFSDVYTALGSEVTFIEALPNIMPTFDREIAKQAERLLIRERPIDYRTGVFASEVTPGIPGEKPVTIKMIDAETKEHVETLEVDAAMVATGRVPNTANMGLEDAGITTSRGFVAVDEKMRVLTSHDDGEAVPHVYCIGDANGKMMLAHAASAQGISAVENICDRPHEVNHDAIPAACFTHPEIAMVGPTEEQAIERAAKEGWTLGKSQGSFRANSKALAELEGNGIAKVLYDKDTGKVVAVHIIGIHAADLI